MNRFAGKVALVTGASRGIGRGIALRLAQEGASLAISYTAHPEQAGETEGDIKRHGVDALAVQADSSDVSQIEDLVKQVVDHYGKLDMLVSNAGIEYFGALEEVRQQDFDRVFAVNTRGQFFVVQQAVKHMRAGGRIVCSSSVSATLPFARHALYAGSKAAVEAMVKTLSLELGPRGITINAIAPGGVETDMAARYGQEYQNPALHLSGEEWIKISTAMGRPGTPEDIAALVAFLVSDEAAWITGQTFHIDGGMH
jgi:NAD(P)-dependent dehydrogenase (short-subunit alcohol dehydrogenase family)